MGRLSCTSTAWVHASRAWRPPAPSLHRPTCGVPAGPLGGAPRAQRCGVSSDAQRGSSLSSSSPTNTRTGLSSSAPAASADGRVLFRPCRLRRVVPTPHPGDDRYEEGGGGGGAMLSAAGGGQGGQGRDSWRGTAASLAALREQGCMHVAQLGRGPARCARLQPRGQHAPAPYKWWCASQTANHLGGMPASPRLRQAAGSWQLGPTLPPSPHRHGGPGGRGRRRQRRAGFRR